MPNPTFVIAEAGSSHDGDMEKACRLIEAAKECGADAVKFQMTSDPAKMARRRNVPEAMTLYGKYLFPVLDWLPCLKDHADKIGIEFMCTTYLPEDIQHVHPFVERFKISAYESGWREFVEAHISYGKETIMSVNPDKGFFYSRKMKLLHCISKYPVPIEELQMYRIGASALNGLSDHSVSTLTGALAIAAGATIIEKHIRLTLTDKRCPDYPHSLEADTDDNFNTYVRNIREAELAMGDGENG